MSIGDKRVCGDNGISVTSHRRSSSSSSSSKEVLPNKRTVEVYDDCSVSTAARTRKNPLKKRCYPNQRDQSLSKSGSWPLRDNRRVSLIKYNNISFEISLQVIKQHKEIKSRSKNGSVTLSLWLMISFVRNDIALIIIFVYIYVVSAITVKTISFA